MPQQISVYEVEQGDYFGDERLRLLFVCAHPAVDPAVRTPLMLQMVLGLDAARIAFALRVAPKTRGLADFPNIRSWFSRVGDLDAWKPTDPLQDAAAS